jgi:O-antigen/teichoic acid export membrane protein
MTTEQQTPKEVMRGFFGRDLIYVLLWAAQLGAATLLTPVITRLLGPHHYGFAALCVTMMQLLVAMAGFGLNMAVQRTFANKGETAARKVVSLSIVIAAVFFAIATSTGPIWSKALHLGAYRGAIAYTVDWTVCTAVTATILGLLRSRDQLGRFALIGLMQTALSELLSLALVVFVKPTANEYILGEFLGQAATLIVGLFLVRPAWLRRRDFRDLWAVMVFAAPLIPAALSSFVLSASARLVVNADLGVAAAARYAVASNVGMIAILLLYAVSESWMPRIFSMSDQEAVQDALTHSRNALYALLIPLTVGLCVASPVLLRIWAPSSYRPDGLQLYVAMIAVSTFPYAGASTRTRALMRTGKTRPAATVTMLAAALSLAINLVLVPVIHIAGSTVATLVAYIFMQAVVVRYSQPLLELPRPSLRLCIEVAAAVAVVFAALLVPLSVPFLILRALVGVACGLLILAMLSVLRKPPTNRLLIPISHWVHARVGF